MRLPIVYSIMAMLSFDKVCIFQSEKLVQLMEYLVSTGLNESEEKAQFASYMMDLVNESGDIPDYKKQTHNEFKNGSSLVTLFKKYSEDPDIQADF
jgi:hypothetical protein